MPTQVPWTWTQRLGHGFTLQHHLEGIRLFSIHYPELRCSEVIFFEASSPQIMKVNDDLSVQLFRPMSDAIEEGNLQRVIELLDEHPEALDLDTALGSWLHIAAEHDQLAIVKELIKRGIDLNARGGILEGNADIAGLWNHHLLTRERRAHPRRRGLLHRALPGGARCAETYTGRINRGCLHRSWIVFSAIARRIPRGGALGT